MPRFSWNIAEGDVKHHKPPLKYEKFASSHPMAIHLQFWFNQYPTFWPNYFHFPIGFFVSCCCSHLAITIDMVKRRMTFCRALSKKYSRKIFKKILPWSGREWFQKRIILICFTINNIYITYLWLFYYKIPSFKEPYTDHS